MPCLSLIFVYFGLIKFFTCGALEFILWRFRLYAQFGAMLEGSRGGEHGYEVGVLPGVLNLQICSDVGGN